MAKIQIYGRIRPVKKRYGGVQTTDNRVLIKMGEGEEEEEARPFSRAPTAKYDFKFSHVFEENATQDEIFDTVAKRLVDAFLEGYNGTIFAYGQTSSGKTYTIEGSGRRFSERGLIPRVLSVVYAALEKRARDGEETKISISHMEIYQDTGYDLLNAGMRPGALMVTLPKVQVTEGVNGEVVVRGLSSHLAATEEVAQSLLFQGCTCRRVAETSMNQCSSRSHSIFSISLSARAAGSEVVTRSKLNLVDLAGSERVAKTGADGRILQEAKHINLSLHHLEHVIVSLQQQARRSSSQSPVSSRGGQRTTADHTHKSMRSPGRGNGSNPSPRISHRDRADMESSWSPSSRGSPSRLGSRAGGHIPYRNSMLTMVLRDSLGGNCLTAMIATLSVEERNMWETVSTCRFAQRVACITNKARRNEELDDKAVIKKLKKRIAELEREVAVLREQAAMKSPEEGAVPNSPQPLSDKDRLMCHRVLYDFFHGKIQNPVAEGINTVGRFQECLSVLRGIVLHALGIAASPGKTALSLDVLSGGGDQANKRRGKDISQSNTPCSGEQPSVNNSAGSSTPQTQSHERKMVQAAEKTPSPNSRLSSGFGSLLDEELQTLCDSGHDNPDLTRKQQRHVPRPLPAQQVPHPPSSQQESRPPPSQQEPRPPPSQQQTPQSRGASHRQQEPRGRARVLSHAYRDEQVGQSSTGSPQQAVQPLRSHGEHTPPTHSRTDNSPGSHAHSKRQSLSPPHRKSFNATTKATPLPQRSPRKPLHTSSQFHSSPFDHTSPPPSSGWAQLDNDGVVTSPLELRVRKELRKRQEGLQQSEQEQRRLAGELHLLNLRVEEEKLRSQLTEVGEQLSSQHLQVVRTQQAQAGPEQLCAEKIAEQQLKIKQARVHQKLCDVQYELKALEQGQHTRGGSQCSTNTHTSIGHVLNELEQHEIKQSRVEEEIEKLRMSQVEKQLELKEAATRRKLLILKQQLQEGKLTSPPSTEKRVTTESKVGDRTLEGTHTILRPPATAPSPQQQRKKESSIVPKSESDHLALSMGGQYHTVRQHKPELTNSSTKTPSNQTLTITSPPSLSPTQPVSPPFTTTDSPPPYTHKRSSPTATTAAKPHKQSTFGSLLANGWVTEPAKELTPVKGKAAVITESKNDLAPQIPSLRDKASMNQHPSKETIKNSTRPTTTGDSNAVSPRKMDPSPPHLKPASNRQDTTKPSSNKLPGSTTANTKSTSQSQASSSTARQRLTLPEEVKETEYMSALQRQKARVSRIRRCMVAATVIQRAWRDYKWRVQLETS